MRGRPESIVVYVCTCGAWSHSRYDFPNHNARQLETDPHQTHHVSPVTYVPKVIREVGRP